MADRPSWWEQRQIDRAKKQAGYTGERTEDIYLPNKAEMAEEEGRKKAREALKDVLSGRYRDKINNLIKK